ncbi:MAG: ATP-grasp domain-containing protein [Pseudorhodoplanes sp.]|jgi:predicted ATP-grasp superfamily ATP-dependent carboligase|nr:ATP-grasp domain-containing protein [Pseudorhodoplanes sp.]
MRILLSEGSSTSAREAITALAMGGHEIEVCDPNPYCLGRFSRFVGKFHRCPGLRDRPLAYLSFVQDLLSRRRFDVLLPVHEQGYLFAAAQEQLAALVHVALPSFESYRHAHNKAGFHALLKELDLPQPRTQFVANAGQLADISRFPNVVKTAIGTASRGTWLVKSSADLAAASAELQSAGGFDGTVLVQDFVSGEVEHAQAVFRRGELVAMHAYRRIVEGIGGGDAIKDSVSRPLVESHMRRIGQKLAWHGALSIDYVLTEAGPFYIDCNPRLVEPMSAWLCGLDLAGLLVQVSCDAKIGEVPPSRPGVRTHLAMLALLGAAERGASRRDILSECRQLWSRCGPYMNSEEELTPVNRDWLSAVPAGMTALLLITNPGWAGRLAKRGWGNHLLTLKAMRIIESEVVPNLSPS